MLNGVIFDMDGVLLDNVDYHVEAFLRLGREEVEPFGRAQVLKVFGRRNSEMLPALFSRPLSLAEAKRLGERKEAIYREIIRPHLASSLVPGVVELLHGLQVQRFRLAVATSGPPENVELVLEGLGDGCSFDAVVTGDQASKGKPDPEIFLLAAQRIEVEPRECLVFEDSLSGVAAARSAGCFCVALSTTHSRPELEEVAPDRIILDFREVPAGNLEQWLKT